MRWKSLFLWLGKGAQSISSNGASNPLVVRLELSTHYCPQKQFCTRRAMLLPNQTWVVCSKVLISIRVIQDFIYEFTREEPSYQVNMPAPILNICAKRLQKQIANDASRTQFSFHFPESISPHLAQLPVAMIPRQALDEFCFLFIFGTPLSPHRCFECMTWNQSASGLFIRSQPNLMRSVRLKS
ncbi:hypothetical protein VNO78_28646 [Psophocarpus tetragonolobus]|uniref:Uncharacterized protein n=1 Tax=Psophocarpus tetragonolobus TaxID=3891 RepID=A0AAN9X0S7_PSOTE